MTCRPPWIQHENDNLHGRTLLLCTHSLGTPSTEWKISGRKLNNRERHFRLVRLWAIRLTGVYFINAQAIDDQRDME